MLLSSLRQVGRKSADAPLAHARRVATATVAKKPHDYDYDYDIKRIKNAAKALIAGARQAENPEWRHTYQKKKEMERLKRDVLENLRADNSEGRPVETWTVEEFSQSGSNALQPGTYFELRRNAEATYGVVIASGISNIGYNEDTLSMTTRGEMQVHRSTDIMFAVPSFIDSCLIERCGREEQYENEHQLAARLRLLKKAREFEREVEKEMYRIGRAIRDIYPQVRTRHPDEWGSVTTMQVARMIDAKPNIPLVTLFAVHRQLMDRADEFICHPTRHRFVHSFDVRPLSHLRNIEFVKQMVREKSPVIHNFQTKAKVLIDRSRELAAQSVGERASRAEIVDVAKFTPKEQEVITFLRLSMLQGRRIQQDSYAGNVPAIIKDTFRYSEIITAYVTLKFLREIGVLTPWEDMASKDRDLYIPENTEEPIVPSVTTSETKSTIPKEPVKTSGLLTADALEGVRHDFGDTPVYVIDDAQAEELDDGVSVETVPGEPDSAWIHVHVADPTTIVPITHPLSQQIQKRTETYYFGHQSLAMLPEDIGKLCDMGRGGTSGQNVLTFSAKVGPNAEILDYKVRAARVCNVHKLRYDDVNGILLPQVEPARFTPFEPQLSEIENLDISYVLPHANDLKLIYEVTRRVIEDRLRKGTFVFALNSPEIEFLDKPVLQNPSHVVRPVLYRGYPRLRYHVADCKAAESGSRSLVAECMKLAGRVASRFCLEHDIPAIRRAMSNMDFEEATLARILAARNEAGFVDPAVLAQEGVNYQQGELTTEPLGHWLLGIQDGEGYVRTTSPLRRAEDMIMHWQIKSALLPGGGAPPPIGLDTMKRMLAVLNGRKQALKKAYRAHRRQWSHTYIQHFMENQKKGGLFKSDSNPLYEMDGHVIQNPVYNLVRWSSYQDVYVPRLGLTGVLPVKADQPLPVGAHIKVNAKEVFQYDLNQTLEVTLA